MPKKKNYPKWFSKYLPPHCPLKPTEPEKTITQYKEIRQEYISNIRYSKIELIELLGKVNDNQYVQLSATHGYEDDIEQRITVEEAREVPAPNYKSALEYYKNSLKKYEADKELYKVQKKEWDELSKKWKVEEAQEQEAREKILYNKLHKKFGQ